MEAKQDLSAKALLAEVKVDSKKWNSLPLEKDIKQTAKALQEHGLKVIIVKDKKEALEKLKQIIPIGAAVMNGSSTTLIEIGFMDFLNSAEHRWNNLHKKVFSESDKEKRADLRRKSATEADYFVAGVNAIAKTGELVATDATGSRVTAFPFAAKRLVIVSGVNKITKNLDSALKRIREYAFPLENVRSKKVYGSASQLGKTVIIHSEALKDRTILILVKEKLGF